MRLALPSIVAMLIGLAGVTWVFGSSIGKAEAKTGIRFGDPKAGQVLYQEYCSSCHGVDLQGESANWRRFKEDGTLPAPPHDESGHTWHHDDETLFSYTKLGGQKLLALRGISDVKSGMPGFEGQLSDKAIWDILSFIYSTWPTEVQTSQQSRNN